MTTPTPPLTPARREEIRQRLEKATPGPWVRVRLDKGYSLCPAGRPGDIGHVHREEDAALIVMAPADIAVLLAEVKRLRAALREYGRHRVLCRYVVHNGDVACDCGFSAGLGEDGHG